jgi:LysR family hydrogen peroxide-inducible transcriptional activator
MEWIMIDLPKLRHLRYLVALADELHFGRAAERCHVSQSALSKGVQELEATFGVTLAERTKRQVIVTATGHEIVARARRILREAEDMVDLARASGQPLSGDLRLGVIPTVGPYLLPKVMPHLRRDFPDLRLYLREDLTEALIDGLKDGRLDAAIVALPFDIGDLACETLFEDGYMLACARAHPLANMESVASPDLSGRPMMLLERGHCLQRHAISAFEAGDIVEDRSFAATSLHTLVAMVEEGLGITLLPRLAVEAGIAEGHDIALVPAPGAAPRKVVMIWRRNSARAPDFQRLAIALREAEGRTA